MTSLPPVLMVGVLSCLHPERNDAATARKKIKVLISD
jgi:hypothetical protein